VVLELLERLGSVARMVRTGSVRELTGARVWALVALAVAYGEYALRTETPAVARGAGVGASPALALGVGLQVLWLVALIAPLAAGGSFASDRAGGFAALQLTRGAGRARLVIARALALLVVATAAMGAAGLGTALAAWVTFGTSPAEGVGTSVPFAPHLLEASPFAWVLIVGAVYALSTWALLSAGILIAAVRPHPLASRALPPLLTLALGFSMTGRTAYVLNPFERLSFLQVHGVDWNRPSSMLAYWGLTGGVLAAAAVVGYARGEGP